MIGWIWNKFLCKIQGHPDHAYKIVHVRFTSFFSGGLQTVGVVQCSRCKSVIGKV